MRLRMLITSAISLILPAVSTGVLMASDTETYAEEVSPITKPFGAPVPRNPDAIVIHDVEVADSTPFGRKSGESWFAMAEQQTPNLRSNLAAGSSIEGTVGTWIQPGHSGGYFNQSQDGHGYFIEVLADPSSPTGYKLVLTWYVYLNGVQVWILAVGPVVEEGNEHIAYLDAYIYSGGDFPPNFNSNFVSENYWGLISVQFIGCDAAHITWSTGYPGFTSGQLDVIRLTAIAGLGCDPNLGGGSGPQDDHGNTFSTATQLANNECAAGTIEEPGDIDVFFFAPVGVFPIQFTVYTTGNLDTYGALYSVNSNQETFLDSDNNSGDGLNFWMENEADGGAAFYSVHVSGNGNATGDYHVTFDVGNSSCGGVGPGGNGNSPQSVRVDFDNKLLRPIRVYLNDSLLGSVDPQNIQGGDYELEIGDVFRWEVIKVEDFGDEMGGTFSPYNGNSTSLTYEVDNIVGSTAFFNPFITNNRSTRYLLGVNMGLGHENRCNCVIPGNTSNVTAGYFFLFGNSNVRLYNEGSNYTGSYLYWENFANGVEQDTGRISLTVQP